MIPVLYFTELLREILTSLETVKQNQQLMMLQLQRLVPAGVPAGVPELTEIPLNSLEELRTLEGSINSQAEYKRNLVGEIVALWSFFTKDVMSYGCP